ncbi:hypothetical protein MKX01_018387 [Papaver californicum]|nr:hypothetical protein MKX01_018387 [Papaver californicum]
MKTVIFISVHVESSLVQVNQEKHYAVIIKIDIYFSFVYLVIVEQERVIVKNMYGENLVGVLHETGSTRIVILCHGFQSSKDSRIKRNLAKVLTKQEISVFQFDFSGNGFRESEGTFQRGNYIKEADGLHFVVMHFIGMKRVVGTIVGHSKGEEMWCSYMLQSSKNYDVPTDANVSGRYNMEGADIE